jgi:hypothetical protein
VLLAVPLSLIGAFWLLYLLDYNMSIAVWALADLYLVFQPDRHRLTVQAYEGGW